ncbi:MAG: polyhydroxyalkanoic acid system family protein, partial [bacterium]
LGRVRKLLEDLRKQYASSITDLHEEWDGNAGKFRLSAMGYSVSGTLTVNESEVGISGVLPFAALLFKAQIEAAIRAKAASLLA